MKQNIKDFLSNWKNVLIIFFISKLFFISVIYVSDVKYNELFNLFDAEHFKNIAKYGYTNINQTAFFPFIPLLIRYIGNIGLLIINNIAFIFSMFILNNLTEHKNKNEMVNNWGLCLFAFSPISFFSMIEYTEAIFVFLTLIIFYLFVKRKFGFIYGIVIGICVATRNSGSMLFFSIFIGMMYLFYKKDIKFTQILKTYIPATIISCLYPIFLQIKFNNWKIFMDCQFECWARMKTNPIQLIYYQIMVIFNDNFQELDNYAKLFYKINEIITIIIFCIFILLLLNSLIKDIKQKCFNINNIVLYFYTISSIVCFNLTIRVPYKNGPTISFFRYYLGLFSFYLLFNKMKNKSIKIIITSFIVFLSMITTFYFCSNVFFY